MAKILIVEDNFDNSNLVRLLLEMEGYEVISALNGEEGLDLAHSEKPDLIALDLDMPIMDGWELLRRAKDDPDIQNIPIVVVTARLQPDDSYKVIEAGGVGYISKPFGVKTLVNEIKKHLPA